jgi:hypothetical protein
MYARGEEGYEHIDYRDPVWADNYGGEYNGADYCAGCHYNIVMTDDCLP